MYYLLSTTARIPTFFCCTQIDIIHNHEVLSLTFTNNQMFTLHTNNKEIGKHGYPNATINCCSFVLFDFFPKLIYMYIGQQQQIFFFFVW